MSSLSFHYDLRMVDIQPYRNVYTPILERQVVDWSRTHRPWRESLESAIDWLFAEALQRTFQCPVINHLPSEFGDYLLADNPSFLFDVSPIFISLLRSQQSLYQPSAPIEHLKLLVAGNLMVVAIYRTPPNLTASLQHSL